MAQPRARKLNPTSTIADPKSAPTPSLGSRIAVSYERLFDENADSFYGAFCAGQKQYHMPAAVANRKAQAVRRNDELLAWIIEQDSK